MSAGTGDIFPSLRAESAPADHDARLQNWDSVTMSLLNDPVLEQILASLHAKSAGQSEDFNSHYKKEAELDSLEKDARQKAFLADKLVALDRDKAEFCYQICRAINARNIVEVGTSFGVSTLYLAAALRDNASDGLPIGRVIGTEYEPVKIAEARKNFLSAGLGDYIDLREGDLRETLRNIEPVIDFVLVDIWVPMARPALELIYPRLRRGATVICDNTEACREDYADYFSFINEPANGFRTMTLPFGGGLDLTVFNGR